MTTELEREIIKDIIEKYGRVMVYNPNEDGYPYYIKVRDLGTFMGSTRLKALMQAVYKINEINNER